MKLNLQHMCKRYALNMGIEEYAKLCGVPYDVYKDFEEGYEVPRKYFDKINTNPERYIRNLPRRTYLRLRIQEEAIGLDYATDEEKIKMLAHIQIHVSKLQLDYISPLDLED